MSAAPILAAFRQALSEAWAGGAGALLPLGFLGGACVLVPLGIGTEGETLRAVGPGILWVALALSSLVTLERIFQADTEDGTLDLWLQSDAPVAAIAAAKTLAHWLAAGLPLALASPVIALMFQAEAGPALLVNLGLYALGSLAFFFWGGVGAALSATVRRGGLLIALIALPLFVPTAIFGALAMTGGPGSEGAPMLLAASSLFACAVAPYAMAAALRLAAD
ncbi:heme exporter protein CcmB [Hyphomonas sp.]|uniref:heme exporter protein CcmB n=1 Tax=Hyphomonas sp. TaxID=87 RepID=UPI0039187E56